VLRSVERFAGFVAFAVSSMLPLAGTQREHAPPGSLRLDTRLIVEPSITWP
jgi:hypothetical protein